MLLYSVEYSQLLFLMIAICIKQPVSITSGAKKVYIDGHGDSIKLA
jgi:hypothetical protein